MVFLHRVYISTCSLFATFCIDTIGVAASCLHFLFEIIWAAFKHPHFIHFLVCEILDLRGKMVLRINTCQCPGCPLHSRKIIFSICVSSSYVFFFKVSSCCFVIVGYHRLVFCNTCEVSQA